MISLKKIYEDITANDPILAKVRANKDLLQKQKADWKKTLSKRSYGQKRQALEDKLNDINSELKDLVISRRELYKDQEEEAGYPDWSEEKAQEYGDRLNDIENKIEKLKVLKDKIEQKLSY